MALPARLNYPLPPIARRDTFQCRESFGWSKGQEAFYPPEIRIRVADLRDAVRRTDRFWSPVYRRRRRCLTPFHAGPPREPPRLEPEPTTESYTPDEPCPTVPARPLPPVSVTRSPTPEASCTLLQEESPIPPPARYKVPIHKRFMRRPIVGTCLPLRESDPLFVELTRSPELKPIKFDTQAAAFKFYNLSYPLILRRLVVGDEDTRPVTPTRRIKSPESPLQLAIQRKVEMNKRVEQLNELLGRLVADEEEEPMMTELYSATFDPSKWSFSKVDQAALCRRYTIDAIMRELHGGV